MNAIFFAKPFYDTLGADNEMKTVFGNGEKATRRLSLIAPHQMFIPSLCWPTIITWILDRLEEAALKGKTVFGMMHHGIVEQSY